MTNRQLLDTSCFVCGNARTLTLFLCDLCFETASVQIHPNWLSPAYLEAMQEEERRLDRQQAAKDRAKLRAKGLAA